jgi:hypothetical protein
MTTGAKPGLGTQLQRDDGAGNYSTIAEVDNIAGPSEGLDNDDATSLDSAAREFIGTIVNSGQVTFDLNFLPGNATHQGLISDLRNKALRNFKLNFTQFTPTRVFSFAALVTGFDRSAATSKKTTAKCTLKISGLVTEA